MPLVVAPIGKMLKIIKILADGTTSEKLKNMGFVVDKKITVESYRKGRIVCLVEGSKVALDSELATKIFVSEEVWNY